ncbi:MAG: AAA domain-containing protein, partial [Patescibacteria group bacterium]|nr:AAA domain-containing protein [Patescibacteria group bacterium]
MKNFAKSILNYFATYNETRFRFNRKVPYSWSNDELTLDFSVFPKFEKQLLEKIRSNQSFGLKIDKNQYQVTIDSNKFKNRLTQILNEELDINYLQSCLEQTKEALADEKIITVGEDGEAVKQDIDPKLDKKIKHEAFRIYNLAFRDASSRLLLELQQEKKQDLQDKYNFEHTPPSSFNPSRIEQEIFDNLQKIAKEAGDKETYIATIYNYIQEQEFEIVMYDLHLMLNSYLQFANNRSSFLFFHEITDEKTSYPLYFLEINVKNLTNKIIIENARDILMINTPAINSFKFENVLTTPRACKLENATGNLQTIDHFIQAYYKNSNPVLLQSAFKKLVAKELPPIKCRIGLQLLAEDRKILDYSELITKLDDGPGQKFVDLIGNYVEGNVESTVDEVHSAYKKEYPKKSVKNLISDIPIKLNDSQKRVLLAAKNKKNEIIKVEGPPGTGKSYTITALVYLANLMGKSVLISSHKKQALDVVEEKLTQQFKNLHPKAKPSVLRMTRKSNLGQTPNNIESTLSSPAIGAAADRVLNFNQEAVKQDKASLEESLKEQNKQFWQQSEKYQQYLHHSAHLIQIQKQLYQKQLKLTKIPQETNFSHLSQSKDNFSQFETLNNISWNNFLKLFDRKSKLGDLTTKCDQLNRLQANLIHDLKTEDINQNNLKALTDLVKNLLQHGNKHIALKKFVFTEVDSKEIASVDFEYTESYQKALKIVEMLKKLIKANKGFTSKVFGSKEKTELENTLKFDHPRVYAELQDKKPEEVLDELKATLAQVKQLHEVYPFLNKDYLLVKHKEFNLDDLQKQFEQLYSLKYELLLKTMGQLEDKEKADLSLEEISTNLKVIEQSLNYHQIESDIGEIKQLLNKQEVDLQTVYRELIQIKKVVKKFENGFVQNLNKLLEYYLPALEPFEIKAHDISTFSKLGESNSEIDKFWKLVDHHQQVSHYRTPDLPEKENIKQFEQKVQKLVEHKNDRRLKNLLNHQGDVQRALTAFNSNKRLSSEQAKVLFENLSCIIAPPKLVSEYLPMDKDMVDVLIIDEASQVSIAESISLMLRAKQTIVFGDELQYGAVSARNVSKKYSMRYFKDILDNYEKDKNEKITDELKDQLASEVSENIPKEELTNPETYTVDPNKKEWLKTFGIRTSTLSFAEALANYKTSLDVHFRSFPEIISYSKEKFYKENQINLITNRIRTKPINQVLRFIPVETQGLAGKNVNLDEIDAIRQDLEQLSNNGFKGSIGIITSFKEQADRMLSVLSEELENYHQLKQDNGLEVWFVGDVQGIEKDIVYYSLVEDKDLGNGSLKYIYPVVGGRADNIHHLQKQRLNVGFSRAKDTMVFVHSMALKKYADTALGEALEHYQRIANTTSDNYVEDES